MSPLSALTTIPELGGAIVSLRRLTAADAPHVWAYWSDPAVYSPTSLDVPSEPATLAAINDMNAAFQRGEAVRWGIVPAGSDPVVGDCGLFNFTATSAEIGYLLARPYWGKGLASAAADLCLEFAFRRLGLAEVLATVMDGNERSLRLLERKRFDRVELLPNFRNVRGQAKDFWFLRRQHA